MKIKKVQFIKASDQAKFKEQQIEKIFRQLGARPNTINGNSVLVIAADPDVMDQKVQIAYAELKKLGYDRIAQAVKHFWYISDIQKELPDISIETQNKSDGFLNLKQVFAIYW